MTDDVAPVKASRRQWIGLGVIALPCMLYSMDLTVLNLAVPALSADLEPSASQLLWIIDIYGFMVAGLLITMGTLAGLWTVPWALAFIVGSMLTPKIVRRARPGQRSWAVWLLLLSASPCWPGRPKFRGPRSSCWPP